MNKKPYGYIYVVLIPTSEGNRFYVGQKKGSSVKETYWGSGTKVKDWFIKHTGHHSKCCDKNIAEALGVRRKIIGWAKNKECLCSMEKIYVSFILDNPLFWNLNVGGHGGSVKGRKLKKGYVFTEVHRQKLRELRLGKKASPELRAKYSMMRKGKNNPRYGIKWSKEDRQKHSQIMTEYWKTHIPSRTKHKLKNKGAKK